MGNDGGTIAKGRVFREKEEREPVDPDNVPRTCALLLLPFGCEPVVGDCRGKVYLKEKVYEYLVEKRRDVPHLRLVHDIVPLTVEWLRGKLVCLATKNQASCYLRLCGCVLSEKIVREVREHGKCPHCLKEFSTVDIVRLYETQKNKETYAELKKAGLHHDKTKRKSIAMYGSRPGPRGSLRSRPC